MGNPTGHDRNREDEEGKGETEVEGVVVGISQVAEVGSGEADEAAEVGGEEDEQGESGTEKERKAKEGDNGEVEKETEETEKGVERKVGSERSSGEKTKELVLLDEEESDDNERILDERVARRRLRTRRQEMREAGGTLVEAVSKVVERFQEAEKRRKGKQVMVTEKRKPRQASLSVVIHEPSEEAMDTSESEDSEGVYEKFVVEVDKELLEAMVYLRDKKRKDYAGSVAKEKKAKSGKRLRLLSLSGLESEEKFLAYIKAIGFEWLLEHSMVEVPVDLAREFFTSFQFKSTTNLDADSVRFRVFNREMVMNLREWALGLLSQEEDDEGT